MYAIDVSASTAVGEGPRSDNMVIRTDIGSKKCIIDNIYTLLWLAYEPYATYFQSILCSWIIYFKIIYFLLY